MRARSTLNILLLTVILAACGTTNPSPSGASPTSSTSPVPTGSGAGPTSSPSAGTPSPSPSGATASPSATAATSSPSPSSAAPSPTPTTTHGEMMIVRAYYFLDDRAGGDPALVPVLRTVPKSKATSRAALTALLAGPTTKEQAASPKIRTMIPEATALRGVRIADGVATVDLSGDFATGTARSSLRGRLAQVVYTLTQFATVDRVRFELDGVPVTVFSSAKIDLTKAVTRATYRESFLPTIFVDRPAWGAALGNPGRVTGLTNVFEAQFRITLLDRKGKVLVDRPVHATCGSGCWGRFEVTLEYTVASAQWGTLRVWDPSERDGSPEAVRAYPVWLSRAP